MVQLATLAVFEMLIIVASFQDRTEYKRTSAEQRGKVVKAKRFIVNGEDAIPHEFPWTVYIAVKMKNGAIFGCTGSLISPRIVLTAAHCVKNTTRAEQNVFDARTAGIFPGWHKNPLKEALKRNTQVLDVAPLHSSVFVLPRLPNVYPNYMSYDYSVIILDKPLKRNKTVQFAKLADGTSPPAKSLLCYTAGFGDMVKQNSTIQEQMQNASAEAYRSYQLSITPSVLQKLRYKILSGSRCHELMRKRLMEFPNMKKHMAELLMKDYDFQMRKGSLICGLQARRPSGTCIGDSGGPLMCRREAGQWVLYGVVDFALGTCTDVSLFESVIPISGWLKKMVDKYDPKYRPEFASRGDGTPAFQAKRREEESAAALKPKSDANRD